MTSYYRRAFLFLVVAALFAAAQVSAQGYKVELVTSTAPPELSTAVRDTLSGQALRVSNASGLMCEIWTRKTVPGAAPQEQLGVIYPQLTFGTLVGVIRFPVEVKDYRRATIKAGVYTLRYALSPVNGNHQGVAPQRDFLLAIPAAADQDPAAVSEAQTIELSKKSTSTNHASAWSLAPAEGAATAAPAVTHDSANDLWILQFSVPVVRSMGGAANGAATLVRMGLAVVGFGPEV